MKTKAGRKQVRIVMEDGEPSAVILDIKEYREMLERLEDLDDLMELERMRRKPLKFRRLDEFLAERSADV